MTGLTVCIAHCEPSCSQQHQHTAHTSDCVRARACHCPRSRSFGFAMALWPCRRLCQVAGCLARLARAPLSRICAACTRACPGGSRGGGEEGACRTPCVGTSRWSTTLCEPGNDVPPGTEGTDSSSAGYFLSFATTCHDTTLRRLTRRPSLPTPDVTQRTFVRR
jgi:hypothetical protein